MLYTAVFGENKIYLYLLLEHKSWFTNKTPLQLFEYIHKVWLYHAKTTKKAFPLPIVIPMILYHGEDTWTMGTRFISMFGKPDEIPAQLKPYLPDFKYWLMNLSEFEDDQIKGTHFWNAILMLYKYSATPEYAEKIPEILKLLQKELKNDKDAEIIESLLHYLFSTQNKELSEIIEVIKPNLPKEKEEILMTTADKLRKEGRQEGIQEGKLEGIQEGIQEGKLEGRQDALISTVNTRFKHVPKDIIMKIKTINNGEKIIFLNQKAILCADLDEYRKIVYQTITD